MEIEAELDSIRWKYQEIMRKLKVAEQISRALPGEQLAESIKTTRKHQGLTIHDVCELSGVSYATLSKIERGSLSVRLDIVLKVTGVLGLKLWIG